MRKLSYARDTLEVRGGDATKKLLFKANFNELYIVRVAKELQCVDPDDPAEVLTLRPLKFRLRMNMKLTLYFADVAEIEEVFASTQVTNQAECFDFTYKVKARLSRHAVVASFGRDKSQLFVMH